MYDWQTRVTCSVQQGQAQLKAVRLMPTAGCDPDEPASEGKWEHTLPGSHTTQEGAYVLAGSLTTGQPALEVALPLAKPDQRCRAVVYLSDGQLDRIEVHLERKYAPFVPGRPAPELESQQTTVSGRPRLDPAELAGSWESDQHHTLR